MAMAPHTRGQNGRWDERSGDTLEQLDQIIYTYLGIYLDFL